MKKLSDKDLIETYKAALIVENMAKDFIELLREELIKRSLFSNFGDY
ncbi:sporulation histidine kinase inhibitor Sda [Bacillus sp. V3B]|nr:sporulation histidine kinase inhibitor Sda [Bacillus sp. V3B]